MKKSRVGKLILTLLIIAGTVEVGITIGYYMLVNIDFNKYNVEYQVEVVK